MGHMDNFTIAILAGAAAVILVFGLMIVLDKGTPVPPANTSAKTTKR